MHETTLLAALCASCFVLASGRATAQVHYHKDGRPWKIQTRRGPDAEVPGWYYNLGITGLRVQLLAERPKALLVKHVFAGTPADRRVQVGDLIVGVQGRRFVEAHQNGYGMKVFGPKGPIFEFAQALEACQSKQAGGRLSLQLERDGQREEARLRVSTKYGQFGAAYPANCKKSELIRKELLAWLAEQQRPDGFWGKPQHDTFAPLAMLASGEARYLKIFDKNARRHAATTKAEDRSSLINWRYMSAAIVLSEHYLARRERWVLPELREIYSFLRWSQFTDAKQINPKSKRTHPGSYPKQRLDSHGGWGHNPGFEGYGPIAMITGQGALAYALMQRCGVDIDRKRHDFAYAFLARGTGRNGYLWYKDQVAGHDNYADMGRTGASGVANFLAPYPGGEYRKRALAHAKIIGEQPLSFPDTHGSPIMGMGYAAAAAHFDPASFRRLMDANKWWFVLSQCCDGSFYYQPNRDNAGYGADSRVSASAVTAFIFSLPKKNLAVSGRKLR